jgi:hypothetical protein
MTPSFKGHEELLHYMKRKTFTFGLVLRLPQVRYAIANILSFQVHHMEKLQAEFIGLVGHVLDEFAPAFARHQLLIDSQISIWIETLVAIVHEWLPNSRGKSKFVLK